MGFCFLCLSGEHIVTFDIMSFKLSKVQLYQDNNPVSTQPSELLHVEDFLTLTFDTKNGANNKHIGHGCSTPMTLFPS